MDTILVLSDHFWGINSDVVFFLSSKSSFSDIKKNTPKSYGIESSRPLPLPGTENIHNSATFFLDGLPHQKQRVCMQTG